MRRKLPLTAVGVCVGLLAWCGWASALDDTTPPRLTAFSAAPRSEARAPLAQLRLEMTLRDDGSGLCWQTVQWQGPTGQQLNQRVYLSGAPLWRVHTALPLPPEAEPGAWRVERVDIADCAGHHMGYDHAQLAALGNAVTQVSNRGLSDAIAPGLVSGVIRTPQVRVGEPPPGSVLRSGQVRVELLTAEAGDVVSGLSDAALDLCRLEAPQQSLPLTGSSGGARGEVRTWTPLSGLTEQALPGLYHLCRLTLTDRAGNRRVSTSILLGGETDFSTFFDNTIVEVRP